MESFFFPLGASQPMGLVRLLSIILWILLAAFLRFFCTLPANSATTLRRVSNPVRPAPSAHESATSAAAATTAAAAAAATAAATATATATARRPGLLPTSSSPGPTKPYAFFSDQKGRPLFKFPYSLLQSPVIRIRSSAMWIHRPRASWDLRTHPPLSGARQANDKGSMSLCHRKNEICEEPPCVCVCVCVCVTNFFGNGH